MTQRVFSQVGPNQAAAVARPPMQRTALAGGALACAALALVLITGPNASARIPVTLIVAAGLALALALARRGLSALRGGEGLVLAVGVLSLLFTGALWFVTAAVGGAQLAFAVWTIAVGGALVVTRLARVRERSQLGETPWQAMAGGAGVDHETRRGLVDLVGLLLGGTVFLAGVAVGWGWLTDRWVSVASVLGGSSTIAVIFLAGTTVLGVLSVVAIALVVTWRASSRRAAADGGTWSASSATTPEAGTHRDEQTVAAHLHDSVLQTLSLIGRTADDPARVRQLARQQERSLRAWLAGRDEARADSLAGAMRVVAQEVEDEEPGARIEVVAVGDAPLDRVSDALAGAAREAMRNAVRHAGSPVRVFVEVHNDGVREIFIRDTGPGFELAHVGEQRRGVRDAIIGRMEHLGGTATIDSGPAGTEIALRHPAERLAPAAPEPADAPEDTTGPAPKDQA